MHVQNGETCPNRFCTVCKSDKDASWSGGEWRLRVHHSTEEAGIEPLPSETHIGQSYGSTGVDIPDREVRVTSTTGGQKGDKTEQYDQFPPDALAALAEHYGVGAQKYDKHNFRKGYPWSLSFNALQRHAWAMWRGEDHDPETGSLHLIAVAWHALALAQQQIEGATQHDDRYASGSEDT